MKQQNKKYLFLWSLRAFAFYYSVNIFNFFLLFFRILFIIFSFLRLIFKQTIMYKQRQSLLRIVGREIKKINTIFFCFQIKRRRKFELNSAMLYNCTTFMWFVFHAFRLKIWRPLIVNSAIKKQNSFWNSEIFSIFILQLIM